MGRGAREEVGAAAAQGGLKGRRIKGLGRHPPAGPREGARANVGLFWGASGRAAAPASARRSRRVPPCSDGDGAQGPRPAGAHWQHRWLCSVAGPGSLLREGTPRLPAQSGRGPSCAGVAPLASPSPIKHMVGAKWGVPRRVPHPGQAAGWNGGLQAGRGGPALPARQAGRERLSRDWGNPSPDPPRSRKI